MMEDSYPSSRKKILLHIYIHTYTIKKNQSIISLKKIHKTKPFFKTEKTLSICGTNVEAICSHNIQQFPHKI